jgi:uncharacterized protein
MRRFIDHYLIMWKKNPYRKALLLHGARQVGKTYAIRQLGKTFDYFVEINFETQPKLAAIFDLDLDPKRILRDLCAALNLKPLTPGSTLLFFDEIQSVPQSIIALRYFYELLPELHVIAAGSFLDFAIQQVGMPVGRVQSLYMHPLSFMEFLVALEHVGAVEAMMHHDINNEMSSVVHNKLLGLVTQYLAIGGMPEVVQMWKNTQDLQQCSLIHQTLLSSYRQDFNKYGRQQQIKHLNAIFNNIPIQLGKKFKYSAIEGNYRSRELSPSLDLLCTADVAHKVWYSAGNGIPIGAGVDLSDFKIILLDVGLSQAILGLQLGDWLINADVTFINKGELVEAFVGQELLTYTNPIYDAELFYWHRHKLGGEAELDYLIQQNEHIIPIEVKSGKGNTLRSMHLFLENRPNTPYGIKFSTQNYSVHEKIKAFPLYAIAHSMSEKNADLKNVITTLMQ